MSAGETSAACPKCGSGNGYQRRSSYTGEQLFMWDGTGGLGVEMNRTWVSSVVTCLDCGARMKRPEAMDTENDHGQ